MNESCDVWDVIRFLIDSNEVLQSQNRRLQLIVETLLRESDYAIPGTGPRIRQGTTEETLLSVEKASEKDELLEVHSPAPKPPKPLMVRKEGGVSILSTPTNRRQLGSNLIDARTLKPKLDFTPHNQPNSPRPTTHRVELETRCVATGRPTPGAICEPYTPSRGEEFRSPLTHQTAARDMTISSVAAADLPRSTPVYRNSDILYQNGVKGSGANQLSGAQTSFASTATTAGPSIGGPSLMGGFCSAHTGQFARGSMILPGEWPLTPFGNGIGGCNISGVIPPFCHSGSPECMSASRYPIFNENVGLNREDLAMTVAREKTGANNTMGHQSLSFPRRFMEQPSNPQTAGSSRPNSGAQFVAAQNHQQFVQQRNGLSSVVQQPLIPFARRRKPFVMQQPILGVARRPGI